ncbi:bicyclomycin/multidrug efflux system [Paraliobacillus sp. PM-2]|uniref:MFS transporter n=1 Tax=Paraliobacillus sp. PM-2 TaxID=1462524 RepID=UPI00061BB915|nr:MFS transporter [Paraliobacillus sp. PM-2]CQR46543.1 bicyclomycin/multidrug efflux system [Paraliobacillus sp. PM-2]
MAKTTSTVIVLIYCSVFVASSIYVLIPLQPLLAEKFDVSLQIASLSSTLFVFPYAFGLVFFGLIADHYPLRNILLIGMALLTITTGLLAFNHSLEYIFILRVFQGFFAASFAPVTFSYCFKYFTGTRQAFAIAMLNTGFLFAGVFGQLLSVFLSQSYSYSGVFFAFFLFYLSCFIGLSLTLESNRFIKKKLTKNFFPILMACCRDFTLQKLYSITFFLLLTIILFYGSFEIYLYHEWSDFPYSLQLLRSISLIGILPAFFSSFFLNRFGAKYVLQVQLWIMVLGFIPASIHLNVITIIIASFAMIASTSLSIPMMVLLIGKHAQIYQSTAVSLYSFVLLIGASIGSLLAPRLLFTTILFLIPMIFICLLFIARSVPKQPDDNE